MERAQSHCPGQGVRGEAANVEEGSPGHSEALQVVLKGMVYVLSLKIPS